MVRKMIKTRKISKDRVGKIRQPKNTVIIAVEGTNKTEKIYFNNFDTGNQSYSIVIARGNDTDPLNLIYSLANEIKKRGLDLDNGDKAYCVFDVDLDPQKNRIIEEAKKQAIPLGIEIITSTPSIELWFLLHYEYTTASLTNSEIMKKLKKYLPKYEKSYNIFLDICSKTSLAVERAKKLEQFQKSNKAIIGMVEANPSTEIYKIIEYFQNNGWK